MVPDIIINLRSIQIIVSANPPCPMCDMSIYYYYIKSTPFDPVWSGPGEKMNIAVHWSWIMFVLTIVPINLKLMWNMMGWWMDDGYGYGCLMSMAQFIENNNNWLAARNAVTAIENVLRDRSSNEWRKHTDTHAHKLVPAGAIRVNLLRSVNTRARVYIVHWRMWSYEMRANFVSSFLRIE